MWMLGLEPQASAEATMLLTDEPWLYTLKDLKISFWCSYLMTSVTAVIVLNFYLFTHLENTMTWDQQSFKKAITIYLCVWVRVGRGACTEVRGQLGVGGHFSPSTTRIMGIKLRSLGLLPSNFTYRAISLACQEFLNYLNFLVLQRKFHIPILFFNENVGIKYRALSLLDKYSITEKYHNLFV